MLIYLVTNLLTHFSIKEMFRKMPTAPLYLSKYLIRHETISLPATLGHAFFMRNEQNGHCTSTSHIFEGACVRRLAN